MLVTGSWIMDLIRLRILDFGFLELLRSVNYNGQNFLNLKSNFKNLRWHSTCRWKNGL